MGRTIAASIVSKLDDAEVSPFYAVDLLFDTTPIYAWTGMNEITLNSNTYTGVGNLLQISEVQESQDISAKGMTLTLSGIPSDLLTYALNTPYQGRECKLYLGFMTSWASPDTSPDIVEIFSGYMDQMTINEGPETSTISTSVESRLIDLERPRSRRYTAENQKQRFAGDKAFDFVESLQNLRLQWGGGG